VVVLRIPPRSAGQYQRVLTRLVGVQLAGNENKDD